MKVRLIAQDSKIPNLAIMKISSYHKAKGDDVDWYNPILDVMDTDKLYISKVFTFSPDPMKTIPMPINAEIIRGGTGYDYKIKLLDEIENICDLDYSLYPDCDYSIIFTTRGCIRKCPFCVVPKKEGLIHNVCIPKLNPKGKYIMLLDNNFFANKTWRENLKVLQGFNQPLNFASGIDLRLLNEEQCEALAKTKIKVIHCAFDNYEDKDVVIPKLELLTKYIKGYKIICYVLVGFKSKKVLDEDLERVKLIKDLGASPFVMVYQDFDDPNYEKSLECKQLARWVNRREIFKSCTWEEYLENRGNRI